MTAVGGTPNNPWNPTGDEMTWIVGMPFMLGYPVLISDIRVTWPDGIERDCLQKVYPVGRYIAAGFAGSVFSGFVMVENLGRVLNRMPEGYAWIPRQVALEWRRKARYIYRRILEAHPEVSSAGCQLVFAGVSPQEDMGIPGTAKPWVWKMSAPDFEPEFASMNTPVSIGSGETCEEYRRILQSLADQHETFPLYQAEVGMLGGFGMVLQFFLSQKIGEHPFPGVSPFVHLCLIRRGEILLRGIDRSYYPLGGEKVENPMPPVIGSYEAFRQYSRENGLSEAEATC